MAERKKEKFSRDVYEESVKREVPKSGPATRMAEQNAHETGKLDHIVDPAADGLIRRSLPRFVIQKNGLYRLDLGIPMALITRTDTTGSLGNSVEIILRSLADLYELSDRNLSQYDLQVLMEIFGDIQDRFVLCRSQFEFTAPKILEYLMKMVPERDGGDIPEDGQYGLFAEAFLSEIAINKIFGLKGYDFTITDAPGRMLFEKRQITRIFGDDVFNVIASNGHVIDPYKLPTLIEVMQLVRKYFHAFVLQVRDKINGNIFREDTTKFWAQTHGSDCVIQLSDVEYTPQAISAIIGLTEGKLDLQNVEEFLIAAGVDKIAARDLTHSLSKIPIGAQMLLPGYGNIPAKGSLFRNKTDTRPMTAEEIADYLAELKSKEGERPPGTDWL